MTALYSDSDAISFESNNLITVQHKFDVYEAYQRALADEDISPPLAAILSLTELVTRSDAGTMFELVQALNDGAETLKKRVPNPIGLTAGCELFIGFVTLFPHESVSFSELKREIVRQGKTYTFHAVNFRAKIAELTLGFIKDDSVILTHSYSRVVTQALLHAHTRKRISVYVTEARPRGLGLKTYDILTAVGIPCTVVLDSAVAYVMDKVDFVLVGSEAVVESGGLINAVGSNQMAIIAKAENKPFYALAESYKFHRLFPLSQYDLPTHNSGILSFPHPKNPHSKERMQISVQSTENCDPSTVSNDHTTMSAPLSTLSSQRTMTSEQMSRNPDVDYTRPDLISLVFSDVGVLTPEGVSQYLVGMFAGL
ncbi:IF-2B-domain-containing protein [Multifurca ochricompacta]|uniref:Translation initiation factor eIF2B subunit alpha n=1 Tax=Multifurca ochricompacta TaxID=376703 RepID=A0AAD4QS65_9AGAM|nr:IF-2B-domain-containing protein [Multifurca ochricompacta]